jgi:hypothetical protein
VAEIPTPTGYSAGTKERPFGITILAILMMLGGLLNLISLPTAFGPYGYGPIYAAWSGIAGIIGLVLGYSMWTLTPWARKAAIIWYIISLLMSFILAYVLAYLLSAILESILPGFGLITVIITMIPAMIIDLIVILYLNSGGVKAAFQEVGGW